MNKIEGIIFDMDGTLYPFDYGLTIHFGSSHFAEQMRTNVLTFFQTQFDLDREAAKLAYETINQKYSGEVSLGLEKEFGIPREHYFSKTWDMNPAKFMETNERLEEVLKSLTIKSGVLSAAPSIWVERVLNFLQIKEIFGKAIFTGEPDLRKPDPQAFLQLAELWKVAPQSLIAIGDQEQTDILPPKSLGMKTIKIGRDKETQADFVAPNVIAAIALLQKENLI